MIIFLNVMILINSFMMHYSFVIYYLFFKIFETLSYFPNASNPSF